MPEYETTYILDGNLSNEEVEQIIDQYSEEVKTQGGEVLNKNSWGKRRFAYTVKGKTEGHYVTMVFKADSLVAKELARILKISDKVVRSLLILNPK